MLSFKALSDDFSSVLKQKSVLTIRLDEHPMLRSKVVAEESISFDDAQRLLSASDECKGEVDLYSFMQILTMFHQITNSEMIQ